MQLRPDIHTVLFISLVVLLTLVVWRTAGGVLAAKGSTVGSTMLGMTG